MGGCVACGDVDDDSDGKHLSNMQAQDVSSQSSSLSSVMRLLPRSPSVTDNHLYIYTVINGYLRYLLSLLDRRSNILISTPAQFPICISQIICHFLPCSILTCITMRKAFLKFITHQKSMSVDEMTGEKTHVFVDQAYMAAHLSSHYRSLFHDDNEARVNLYEICNLFPYHSSVCVVFGKAVEFDFASLYTDLRDLQYKFRIELQLPWDLSADKSFVAHTQQKMESFRRQFQKRGWILKLVTNQDSFATSVLMQRGYFTMYYLGHFITRKIASDAKTVERVYAQSKIPDAYITHAEVAGVLSFCGILLYAFLQKKNQSHAADAKFNKKAMIATFAAVGPWIIHNGLNAQTQQRLESSEFERVGQWLKDYHIRDRVEGSRYR